jgi:hypothetical protein
MFMNRYGIKKGDIFLVVLLLAAAAAIWGLFATQQTDRVYGEIWQDGERIYQFQLSDDYEKTLEIQGKTYTDTVEIKDGKMRFVSADCPDKVCVHTGWISKSGQLAVCIPNRVMIRIVGGETEVDAVTS